MASSLPMNVIMPRRSPMSRILKTTHAKYIYGLSATPTRKDGHHPILFMHCGPIRYRDNPKKQAENRPFDHYIIPRFTPLRVPLGTDSKDLSIQELYTEIMDSDFRNQLIVEDLLRNYRQGRSCLVLTLRKAHVERLAKRIEENIPDVIVLTGGMGRKSNPGSLRAHRQHSRRKKYRSGGNRPFYRRGV